MRLADVARARHPPNGGWRRAGAAADASGVIAGGLAAEAPSRGRGSVAIAALALAALATAGVLALPARVSPWSIAVPGFALAVLGLDRLRLGRSTMIVLTVGLASYAGYLTYTSYGERNFDGPEQLAYVQYIARTGAIPPAGACFVCHHPPAYYVAAAGLYRFFEVVPIVPPAQGAQLLSLALAGAFAVFGALTLRLLEPEPRDLALGTALIACWPYSILNSARLHNDVLLSAAMAASLYFLVSWYQRGRARDLWASALLALLAVLTKVNGLVMVATVLLTVAARLARARRRRFAGGRALPAVLVLVLGTGGFALARGAGDLGARPLLGTAADIGAHEWVQNEPRTYLGFDLYDYLTEPYVFARRDEGGRQHYWNHLLKSSLFSTHNTEPDAETAHRLNRGIAAIMSPLLLLLAAIPLLRLVLVPARGWLGRCLPLVIGSVCLLAAHIAFKVMVPAAHHNDFRFVHPIVIPFACAVAIGAGALAGRSGRLASIARGLAWGFAVLSIVYFLPLGPLVSPDAERARPSVRVARSPRGRGPRGVGALARALSLPRRVGAQSYVLLAEPSHFRLEVEARRARFSWCRARP